MCCVEKEEILMTIKQVNHITINVKDLDASLAFYGNVMGLERMNSIDMGDHMLDYMKLPGGVRLEFISYKFKTRSPDSVETDAGKLRHLALEVDDLDELEGRCRKAGVKIRLQPVYVEKLRCRTMLVEDPNGVELEFVQI
jgi:lactoylglutathione lyase